MLYYAEIMKFSQLYSVGTGGDFNYADSQVLFHKAFDLVDIISNEKSSFFDTVRKSNDYKLNEKIIINNKEIELCYTIHDDMCTTQVLSLLEGRA